MAYLFVAALTFGALYLLDKGFQKLFRNQAQHRSGTAVRLAKGYALACIALGLLAVLCLIQYINEGETLMLLGFAAIGLMSGGLGAYYLSTGIFYDDDSFLYTTIGKKQMTYRYGEISGQKLYQLQGGAHLVELYMTDGKTVSVQTSMPGAYDFLDKACHARFRQLGINSFECDWFDESQSCWFPPVEG